MSVLILLTYILLSSFLAKFGAIGLALLPCLGFGFLEAGFLSLQANWNGSMDEPA